jgi:IclR family acetate operon transcriptional repressor
MGRGSLQRGIDILSFVASANHALDANSIATECGLPQSSAYRLLQTLRGRGLIDTAPDGTGYRLGLIVLQWAAALRGGLSVVEFTSPVLRRLASLTGETATLTLLQGARAVVAHVTDTTARLRVTSQVGSALPLHAGASSKAILAFLPRERRREVTGKGPLIAFTPKTITNRQELWRECERIRAFGFAESDEEVLVGARGVAAPFFDEHGMVGGSIAVAGPRQRFQGKALRVAADSLRREAQALSRALGFSGGGGSLAETLPSLVGSSDPPAKPGENRSFTGSARRGREEVGRP